MDKSALCQLLAAAPKLPPLLQGQLGLCKGSGEAAQCAEQRALWRGGLPHLAAALGARSSQWTPAGRGCATAAQSPCRALSAAAAAQVGMQGG